MGPGSLLRPKWGAIHIYNSITRYNFLGSLEEDDICILLESKIHRLKYGPLGRDQQKLRMCKILFNGTQGWVEAEQVEEVR